jgi:hypothetical protein
MCGWLKVSIDDCEERPISGLPEIGDHSVKVGYGDLDSRSRWLAMTIQ